MREIRGTIGQSRTDRIVHHLAECHREIREAEGLDAIDEAEFGRLIDTAKTAVMKRTVPDPRATR